MEGIRGALSKEGVTMVGCILTLISKPPHSPPPSPPSLLFLSSVSYLLSPLSSLLSSPLSSPLPSLLSPLYSLLSRIDCARFPHLKPQHDKPVLNISFNFHLRPYTKVGCIDPRNFAMGLAGFHDKEAWTQDVHRLNTKLKAGG